MPGSIAAYRAKVLTAHRPAFDLFANVSGVMEAAMVKPRALREVPDTAIDMFMIQAHKAYGAAALLAQHGLMEDAATITRRLMELGVQTVYVGAEADNRLQRRKAGKYLAFLWRQLPRRIRLRLPSELRAQWSAIGRGYGRFIPKKAKRWSPNWREMFREIGAEQTYDADYAFLSAIAHGRPDNQIFTFSQPTVRVHSHEFVSVLLTYATRYYLMVAEQWNRRFGHVPQASFDALVMQSVEFRPRGS